MRCTYIWQTKLAYSRAYVAMKETYLYMTKAIRDAHIWQTKLMLGWKRHIYMTKEMHIFDKGNLQTLIHICQWKRHITTKEMHIWQTKLAYSRMYVAMKETYIHVKRDAQIWQTKLAYSHIYVAIKETCIYDKWDAHSWQTKRAHSCGDPWWHHRCISMYWGGGNSIPLVCFVPLSYWGKLR